MNSSAPPGADERLTSELVWVRLHSYLEERGYRMRARYHPGWSPSWLNDPNAISFMCEDGVWPVKYNILDATRIEDGAQVIMKLLDTDLDRLSVPQMQYFSADDRQSDSRNHCVPLLDLLPVDDDPRSVILVQPRLVPWDIWPFKCVGEVVEFLGQIFEGIAYMHEHHAAHLDASWGNIMMDGLHLFLEPNHPGAPAKKACGQGKARHIARHESKQPVKYYFIDFDQSVRFPDPSARRPIRRTRGQDKTLPEDCLPDPYDPFKADIYCLGNFILIHLLNGYTNVEFIRPLSEWMMRSIPSDRPTAQQVADAFAAVLRSLSPRQLRASPGHVRGYDFTDYLIGNIPARPPTRSIVDRVTRLWRGQKRARTSSTGIPAPGAHASDGALRMSRSLS
ncbi:hypothetical protein AURDEDRAFT_102534 [Auricularia subglabra TFB-10046 SS5]|nr:hypothetical protein AURDEDRAFT_102534 [Auricularia subglabra TFB-10046 SS5]